MTIDDVLNELRTKISTKLPKGITISDLEFEGPELVIYTTEPKAFADNGDIIRSLAKDLRKRIVVRPDPKMLLDAEQAVDKIKQIVPPESGVSNFYFDTDTGEVIIEAEKPGLVIGLARLHAARDHQAHRLDTQGRPDSAHRVHDREEHPAVPAIGERRTQGHPEDHRPENSPARPVQGPVDQDHHPRRL